MDMCKKGALLKRVSDGRLGLYPPHLNILGHICPEWPTEEQLKKFKAKADEINSRPNT